MERANRPTPAGMKKRIADAILIVALLVAGGIALFFTRSCAKSGKTVKVTADGTVSYYSLERDTRTEIVGYRGGTDLLVIRDGYAYFESASCPDHLCVKTGKISRVGQSIVCLPNRVSAEIVGEGAEVDFYR